MLRTAKQLVRERDHRSLLLCSALIGLSGSFVLPYLSLFGTGEIGVSVGNFGAFMAVTALAHLLVGSVVTRHSDRGRSRRRLLILASGAGACGYFGYAFIRNLWCLSLIGMLVLGVASLAFAQLFAHARERLGQSGLPASEAPLYMNAFRTAYAAAWTFGPALAAGILRRFGFRGLFLAASLIHVALLVLVVASVPSEAALRPTEEPPPVVGRTRWQQADVLRWMVALILIFAAQTISMSSMSLLVLGELGGNEAQVGVIFSLASVFELPLMLGCGLLATRVHAERLIRGALGLAIAYYGTLTIVQAPWHIYPLQLWSAAIVAVTSGVAITFFQDKLPRQFGAATHLYVIAMRVGATSGYVLFAGVGAQFGHRGAFTACAVLSLAALLVTSPFVRHWATPSVDVQRT